MKISYERLVGPSHVYQALAATTGKNLVPQKTISYDTWASLVASAWGVPHSPTRVVKYRFVMEDIPYWISVHLVRHHIGVQFYVQSQRNDNNRDEKRQDSLVNIVMDINANALITLGKARLCNKAASETRGLVQSIRRELTNSKDAYDRIVGGYMRRTCEVYQTCFEPKPCRRGQNGF